jgi:hypothetical protein
MCGTVQDLETALQDSTTTRYWPVNVHLPPIFRNSVFMPSVVYAGP